MYFVLGVFLFASFWVGLAGYIDSISKQEIVSAQASKNARKPNPQRGLASPGETLESATGDRYVSVQGFRVEKGFAKDAKRKVGQFSITPDEGISAASVDNYSVVKNLRTGDTAIRTNKFRVRGLTERELRNIFGNRVVKYYRQIKLGIVKNLSEHEESEFEATPIFIDRQVTPR